MKKKNKKKFNTPDSKSPRFFDDQLDWLGWDEDSIYHKAYIDHLERDLSLGFPRYRRRS